MKKMKATAVLGAAAMAMSMVGVVPAAASETTTISVQIWDRGDAPAGGTVENNKMTEWINEQVADLGIQVEFVSVPRSGSDDALNVMMGGGNAPDIIFTYDQNMFNNYAVNGGLTDLTAALESIGTNVTEYVGDVQSMGNIDGQQLALLSKRGTEWPRHTAYIRQDWLDELGLEMPTNKEELIEVLYKFKEAKPDCIPWAMSGRTDTEKGYLNFIGSYVQLEDEKDAYVYAEAYVTVHDGAIDGLKELNKLYNDGIIGQDFATDTTEDQYKAQVASGNVGFVLDDNTRIFDYLSALNCDSDGNYAQTTFVPVNIFTQEDGETIRNPYEYMYGMYIMVPVTSEDKVEACMTYLNWLADPTVAENIAYTPEHTNDENGVAIAFTGDELNAKGYKSTLDDYNILNKHFTFTETKEGVVAGWTSVNKFETQEWFENLYDTIQTGKYRFPKLAQTVAVETEKGVTIKNDMITYVYRLISCKTDDFDSLQASLYSDMLNVGLQDILDARAEYWDSQVTE